MSMVLMLDCLKWMSMAQKYVLLQLMSMEVQLLDLLQFHHFQLVKLLQLLAQPNSGHLHTIRDHQFNLLLLVHNLLSQLQLPLLLSQPIMPLRMLNLLFILNPVAFNLQLTNPNPLNPAPFKPNLTVSNQPPDQQAIMLSLNITTVTINLSPPTLSNDHLHYDYCIHNQNS